MDWGKKWLVDFSTGKTQPVSFDRYDNTGVIDVKMNMSFLEEKSSFKGCVQYLFIGLFFKSKGEHL